MGHYKVIQPSPLPWNTDKTMSTWFITDSNNNCALAKLTKIGDNDKANAELIVKSVNLFPPLVEALEEMVVTGTHGALAMERAKRVLKEARGVTR